MLVPILSGLCDLIAQAYESKPAEQAEATEDALLAAYKEAWNQYSLHQTINATRQAHIFSLQAAFLAVLGATLGVIVPLKIELVRGENILMGPIIYGGLCCVLSIVALVLLKVWGEISWSLRAYINLRWIAAAQIESELKLGKFGLCSSEHIWRKTNRSGVTVSEKDKGKFYVFRDSKDPLLREMDLVFWEGKGGFRADKKILLYLSILWWIVLALGLSLVATFGWAIYVCHPIAISITGKN
jgi:hypothetical protein